MAAGREERQKIEQFYLHCAAAISERLCPTCHSSLSPEGECFSHQVLARWSIDRENKTVTVERALPHQMWWRE